MELESLAVAARRFRFEPGQGEGRRRSLRPARA
jgi:hypothetical protein